MNFQSFYEAHQDNDEIFDRQLCPVLLSKFFNLSYFEALEQFGAFREWLHEYRKDPESSPTTEYYVHPSFGDVPYPNGRCG